MELGILYDPLVTHSIARAIFIVNLHLKGVRLWSVSSSQDSFHIEKAILVLFDWKINFNLLIMI